MFMHSITTMLYAGQFNLWFLWIDLFTDDSIRHGQELGFKGELNPEMKLCELLELGHCIHLPLTKVASSSAFSGQNYNVGFPVAPNFCDVIDIAIDWNPFAFWDFLAFSQEALLIWSSSLSVSLSSPYYARLLKILRDSLPWKLI